MNGIVSVAFGLLMALYPSSFSDPLPGLMREALYDSRISFVLEYFREDQEETLKNIGANIAAVSRDWKPAREKNISKYLGTKKHTLTIWMFQDLQSSFDTALRSFKKNVPQITVNIKIFTKETEYIAALDGIFRGEEVPDIILMNNGWWTDFKTFFEPFPSEFFSTKECSDFYFPFTCEAFQRQEKMYAIPMFVEPFVMIANQKMLQDDRVALSDRPAKSWPGFLINGVKLPKYYSEKSILTAIKPSTKNHNISKLFSTILLQGAKKEEISRGSIEEILNFMKKIDDLAFIGKENAKRNRNYEKDPYDRFFSGEAAVLFGTKATYQSMLQDFLKNKKTKVNQSDIRIFPVPGISKDDAPVSIGEVWALAVPRQAPNKKQAIALATYMAEEESSDVFSKSSGKTSARMAVADLDVFREVSLLAENPLGQIGTFAFEQEFPENFTAFLSGQKTMEEMTDFILSYLPKYEKKEKSGRAASTESTTRSSEATAGSSRNSEGEG